MRFYVYLGDLLLPVNPERIQMRDAARALVYPVIAQGTVKLPRGFEPESFAWSCFFPGKGRNGASFVNFDLSGGNYDPVRYAERVKNWCRSGAKVRLLVTDMGVDADVFVSQFEYEIRGGWRDVWYSVQLEEYRPLFAGDDERGLSAATGRSGLTVALGGRARNVAESPASYMTVAGDTLVTVAKRTLYDASRWRDVRDANAGVAGVDDEPLPEGLQLTIPGGTA